jgi:hypothetical protein
MTEATRRWSWRSWLPDMSAAISRFPLAVLLAGFLTIYKLWADSPNEADEKILGTLAASFLWVVAVDLFVESQGRSQRARGLAWIAGIAVIALLFHFRWEAWLFPPLLFGSLLFAVGLAAQLQRGERNASFWLFNHRLWLAAALGLLGAVMFGGGLSIILETLNFLFGLELPEKWHERIWTVALGFLAPVSWLALAPQNFTDRISGEETEFTTRAVATIVKFVLVPLLLVYTAILYAYALKIGLAWTLPKGTLGSLVVGYLLAGAATLLLAYPIRDSGGALVRLFWRNWVWLSVLPVLLLFLAVYTRIAAYGLTEPRYAVVLIGVWALILAVWRMVKRGENFDLRVIPGLLAILLLAASFGPWGIVGASVRSQTAELAGILREKGMLADGKFVRPAKGSDSPLGTSAARARQIEYYLNTRHALRRLAPWFEGEQHNPFAEGKSPETTVRELLEAMSLPPDLSRSAGASFTYYADAPEAVSLASSGQLIGPVVFESQGPIQGAIPPQTVKVDGLGTVRLEVAGNSLTAGIENGQELRFDLTEAANRLAGVVVTERRPLPIKAANGPLSGTLLIENLNGTYDGADLGLSLLRVWLVLEREN